MISANGKPVVHLGVAENRNAAWTAIVEVDSDDELTSPVTLDVDGETFVGTAVLGDLEAGRWKATIVGGHGGLNTVLPAKWYVDPTIGSLLTDIARESGEVLDASIPASLLAQRFERWSRMQGEAHLALRLIADQLGYQWRITRAGTIYLGPETWLPVTAKTITESFDPQERRLTIAYDGLSEAPAARPGMTLDGRRIERTALIATPGSLRHDVYFDEEKGQGGLLGMVARRIRELVLPKLSLARLYPGTVVGPALAAGQTHTEVTLLVDDELVAGKWKGLDRVKLAFGIPGVTARIKNGARVRLLFDAGDPSRPRAALWDLGAAVEILVLSVDQEIRLGSSGATDPVALESKVQTAISAMLAAGAAVTPAATPGPATFLAAKTAWDNTLGTSATAAQLAAVGADKVKGV